MYWASKASSIVGEGARDAALQTSTKRNFEEALGQYADKGNVVLPLNLGHLLPEQDHPSSDLRDRVNLTGELSNIRWIPLVRYTKDQHTPSHVLIQKLDLDSFWSRLFYPRIGFRYWQRRGSTEEMTSGERMSSATAVGACLGSVGSFQLSC